MSKKLVKEQFFQMNLNRQNFIEELKIVKKLQKYRNNLKKWHAYHKENVDSTRTVFLE